MTADPGRWVVQPAVRSSTRSLPGSFPEKARVYVRFRAVLRHDLTRGNGGAHCGCSPGWSHFGHTRARERLSPSPRQAECPSTLKSRRLCDLRRRYRGDRSSSHGPHSRHAPTGLRAGGGWPRRAGFPSWSAPISRRLQVSRLTRSRSCYRFLGACLVCESEPDGCRSSALVHGLGYGVPATWDFSCPALG